MVLDPGEPKYILANQIRGTKEHQVITQDTMLSREKPSPDHTGSVPFGYEKARQ